MAAGFGERQRAEEFDRLLDAQLQHAPGDAPGSSVATLHRGLEDRVDEEFAAMLGAVTAVIDNAPLVDPVFKARLALRLQAEHASLFGTESGGGGGLLARRRSAASAWRRRLIGGVVGVGVLSGGIGGVAWAASGALPGDPLYQVKRTLENMRVSVSGSDEERGQQYLGQAKSRLAEIEHLLDRHDANLDGSDTSHLIAATMDALYYDVDNAGILLAPLAEHGDRKALKSLSAFLYQYEPQAQDLETLTAAADQDKALRLVTLMQSLDTRMTAAQTAADRADARSGTHPSTDSTPAARTPRGTPGVASTPTAGETRAPGAVGPTQTGPGTGSGTGTDPATPNPSPSAATPFNVQVPLGSPATTVVLPPLLSGLPPIGITLGNTAPATGPTTDAGPPPTDPNPN